MKSNLGRTPPRYPPNPMQVSEHKTFRLRVGSPSEMMLLIRYLMTTFYARGKQWTSELDEVTFILAGEYFTGYRNEGFYSKHELDFLKVQSLARIVLARSRGELPRHLEAAERLLLAQKVLLNPRAFRGLKQRFEGGFLRTTNRLLKRPCPEPRRIGVGYRDKGTAQTPSFDGSPSWKEVAVSRSRRHPMAFGIFRSPRWYDEVKFF